MIQKWYVMHHMERVLLTWSDRGVSGPVPGHHGVRPSRDPGPVLRLLTAWEGCPTYDAIWVLAAPPGEDKARALVADAGAHARRVVLRVLPVSDPTDHGQLFHALRPVLSELGQGGPRRIDVLLSAGTPQAQTIWIILVQAGLLDARMLQVIPDAFVPDPHPSPVREVRFDIEGFPEIRALREEVRRLRAAVEWKAHGFVGQSPAIRLLAQRAARVAPSDLPVLVHGETGTGKELVARAVHAASPRATAPFVAESCAAFAEGLLASELFGHEAGAFTGAVGRKRGLFELAHGGTLFLDEVGDTPAAVQANLLRVLQEGQLRRVGGEAMVSVDVRLVAATHKDLAMLVSEGRFRQDLYYRLRGVTLEVPPLRERPDDIPLLVEHFLRTKPRAELEIVPRVLRHLAAYQWPGNVRELRAEVQRWKVFCPRRVDVRDLSPEIAGLAPSSPSAPTVVRPLSDVVRAAEEAVIRAALEEHHGNLSQTARALAVDRNTLKRKLAALGMR
jgi:two-component system response regulator AtoC